MVPFEEYFSKLLEAHIQTGHGGRDTMLFYIKKKWRISRIACEIFIQCCSTCNRKRTTIRKGVVVKPITSKEFNSRGQVDLIDFQSNPDGEYKWLLNYQDHATKFLYLRPLKSKEARNVAEELSNFFYFWSSFYPPKRQWSRVCGISDKAVSFDLATLQNSTWKTSASANTGQCGKSECFCGGHVASLDYR